MFTRRNECYHSTDLRLVNILTDFNCLSFIMFQALCVCVGGGVIDTGQGHKLKARALMSQLPF